MVWALDCKKENKNASNKRIGLIEYFGLRISYYLDFKIGKQFAHKSQQVISFVKNYGNTRSVSPQIPSLSKLQTLYQTFFFVVTKLFTSEKRLKMPDFY